MFAFFGFSPMEFLVLGLLAGLVVVSALALVGFLLFLGRRKRRDDD